VVTRHAPPVRHTGRIVSLDLLRGLAAIAVAVPHYVIMDEEQHTVVEAVSVLAVEIFFILSGFVLAPQILACARGGRSGDLGTFLVRRWMRTVPPYILALVAISFLSRPVYPADFARYLFYVQNLFTQSNWRDYFPVAWSLSVEEWFYVLFPLTMFGCARLLSRESDRFCALVAAAFILLIVVARSAFGNYQDWGADVRRVVAYRIDSIAYGFVLYLLVGRVRASAFGPRWIGAAIVAFVACALVALAGALAIADNRSRLSEHLFPFYAAAFGASAIILIVCLDPLLARRPGLSRCCEFLGHISYGVYLFHMIVGILLRPALEGLPMGLQLACYAGLTGAFCTVLYTWFERPILFARPAYAKSTVRAEA
jgi:peptidoglycan/LPS O-acetylase OafA/YrhL